MNILRHTIGSKISLLECTCKNLVFHFMYGGICGIGSDIIIYCSAKCYMGLYVNNQNSFADLSMYSLYLWMAWIH